MKSRVTVAAAATLAFASLSLAEPPAHPAPVIQVGVDLVRIDATVTDKQGRPVTDLRPEEFRLKINGQQVPVENAAFFGGRSAGDGARPFGPAGARLSDAPERSIVFVIDDLNLSPAGVTWTREALQAFAAKWEGRDATIGVRFTSDESDKLLLSRNAARFDAAIRGLRYNAKSVRNWIAYDAIFQQRVYSILTTLNALRSAPGRKALVLISDGLVMNSERSVRGQFGIARPSNRCSRTGIPTRRCG